MTGDFNRAGRSGQPAGEPDPSRLLKPLELERRKGFRDDAVSGGLEPFVARWAPPWAPLFLDYARMAPEGRKAAVLEVLGKLRAAGDPGTPAALSPRGSAAPAVPSGGRDAAEAPPPRPGDPVTRLAALGPRRAEALAGLGIRSVGDLLRHTPRAWQDRGRLKPLDALVEDETATVQARVLSSVNFRARGGLVLTEVALADLARPEATLGAVYFNQPFQRARFPAGAVVVLSGRVQRRGRRLQMLNPESEVLPSGGEDALVHTGRVVPLYSLGKEIGQRVFRSAVWQALPALDALEDPLPEGLRKAHALEPLGAALAGLHFPGSLDAVEPLRRGLAFRELLDLGLGLKLRQRREKAARGPILEGGALARGLLEALPFRLTPAQERVWAELRADLASGRPMRRLLQGDVGSGKTVVAALCLAAAVDAGRQGALMAPTEILAEQHLGSLRRMLEPLGVEVLSLTQSQKGRGRREVLSHLASGRPLVAVGTQALIQEGVRFGRLGLAVVDEQHRFGVRQRLNLARKAEDGGEDGAPEQPHSLVMTATPIPRTLAMTVYGDLDVSVLDALPPGRSPIRTLWERPKGLAKVWEALRSQVAEGRQAYVVVPLIEESDKTQWKAVTRRFEELKGEIFPDLALGLLHGRLKPEEKEAVMAGFASGAVQVLCATTVVEVGVDVPNASVMVVEDADRFGLAQLHQLRGRVGRGAAQSWCYLVAEPKTGEGRRRLEVMVSTTDGFAIAEEDLALRGAGELLGTRQSGLPELRHADLARDQALVAEARRAAEALLEADPDLADPAHRLLREEVRRGYGEKLELGTVG